MSIFYQCFHDHRVISGSGDPTPISELWWFFYAIKLPGRITNIEYQDEKIRECIIKLVFELNVKKRYLY